MARHSNAVLTITDAEPPAKHAGKGGGGIDWAGIDAQLRKARGKWGTFGPWRSTGAAAAHAKKIADDRTPLDAAHYELEPRSHRFDDDVVGSILWLRYVSA
jgi:hypothetical protein